MSQISTPNLVSDSMPIRPWYKKGWGMAIIIMVCLMVALIIVMVVGVIGALKDIENNSADTVSQEQLEQIRLAVKEKSPQRQMLEKINRPNFGNPDAPLVIVEFSDFQCPVCRREFPIIREIINKYKDDLFFIYRQFPTIDEDSIVIGESSLCANEQGKFWVMHDQLFLTDDNITLDNLSNIAKRAGIDMDKFGECLLTQKYRPQISEDAQLAYDLGARGTPTFFINGNKIEGVVSLEQWKEIIGKVKELLGE